MVPSMSQRTAAGREVTTGNSTCGHGQGSDASIRLGLSLKRKARQTGCAKRRIFSVPETPGFTSGRVLVVAFEGWNDAGEAASGVVQTLREQLDVYPIAEVDPEDYFDYQFNRPTVEADEDGARRLIWPGVTVYGPTAPSSTPGAAVYLL